MNIEDVKQIPIADYLHSLGYSPVKQQGNGLWYKSPLREEHEPSFKVNTDRNLWYDFGAGKGGNIIALAKELYCSGSLPYLLNRIAEQTPHVRPVSFSFPQRRTEPSFQHLEVRDLTHPALLRSFLTLRMKNCPTMPDLDRQDYVILNSTVNVPKAIDVLYPYERIHCMLDNDETGYKATQAIALEYSYHVRDFSDNYRGYSDLNDYLCGKKQEQKNSTSQVQEIKQETGQRAAPRQKRGRGI